MMCRSCRGPILWGAAAVLVLLTIVSGCKNAKNQDTVPTEQVPPLVKSMTIRGQETEKPHVYSGEVRSRFEVRMAFRVPGKIIQRNIDPGSTVKAGDILMQIDPADIEQAVAAGKARLAAARSQFNLARDQLNRFEALYREDLMSKSELDRYQNAHDSAKALLTQATAQYTQALNQRSYCDLKADGPGVVLSIHAEAGQVVAAGQPVVIIAKGSRREVEINVPESRIDAFDEGNPFRVTFWALPDIELEGRVRVVSPVADMITRTYTARITLTNPPRAVRLGMTASVTRSNRPQAPDAVYIPVSAIYQTGDKPMVWVIQEDIVQLRPVQLGDLGTGEQVRVLNGLEPGERVVTAGVHKLREGEKVRMGDQAP